MPVDMILLELQSYPDIMTTLDQRWPKVVRSVGPTLDAKVGPKSLSHRANVRPCWANVGPILQVFFPTTFCQRYANIYSLLMPTQKKSIWVKFGHRKRSYNLK